MLHSLAVLHSASATVSSLTAVRLSGFAIVAHWCWTADLISLDFQRHLYESHEVHLVIAGGQGQIHHGLPTSHERIPSICYLSVIV